MSYKTILVHVDESKHIDVRIRVAARIANDENGHVVGVATTGIAKFLNEAVAANPSNLVMAPFVDTLRGRARIALEKFDNIVKRVNTQSYEERFIDDAAAQGFCMQAMYADLVVIGQTDPNEKSMTAGPDFPEYVVMNSHCPNLIVPHSSEATSVGKKILVAWDGSLAAKRSVLGALPLLKRAPNVDLAIFSPAEPWTHAKEERQQGADIALFLARHGVLTHVRAQVSSHNGIGSDLLALAADLKSDLLVMGCYGHSRVSEMLFGGVSRLVLQSMTVPVLMCH